MTYKFADLCIGKGSYGIAASAVEFSPDLPTYLRITDIKDDGTIDFSGLKSVDDPNSAKYYLAPDDIVYARTGASTGRNYFYDGSDGEFVYAGFLIKFSIDPKKVNPKYIKYYCQSKDYYDWVASFNTGSTRGNINAQTLGDMPIPDIPREQQDVLADTLSSLDARIGLNTKINHHLEQMAQAIFKSWFVDFEPFGGVMPDDWREGTFSEIISATLGGDWGKDTPTGNNTKKVYCIRGADIPDVNVGNKGKMPIRFIPPKNYDSKRLAVGDIVIEISGGSPTQSTGRCALITQSLIDRYDQDMVCTNFCRAVKPLTGYSAFVYFYWKYLYDQSVMFSYENGTTGIKNLDITGFLENETIIIPRKDIAVQFAESVYTFIDTIFGNGLENEGLAATRDTLLPRLMSRELFVADL